MRLRPHLRLHGLGAARYLMHQLDPTAYIIVQKIMLMIRLQRVGRKKSPSYRFIVSEKHKDTNADSLEILGHYDPTQNPKVLEVKEDRIKHWLSVGAQPSNTVHNLLIKLGIVDDKKKRKSVVITNKRQAKLDKKNEDKIEADKAKAEAEEAAKAAEAEAKEAAKAAEAEAEAAPAGEAPAPEAAPEETPAEEPKEETVEAPKEEEAEKPKEEVAETPAEEPAAEPVVEAEPEAPTEEEKA